MKADGSGQRNLSNYVDQCNVPRPEEGATSDGEPSWSPDGKRIIFSSGQLYVMNRDGSARLKLTNNDKENDDPGWSPDGKHVVWSLVTYCPTGFFSVQIYVMNVDGSDQHNLSKHADPCKASKGEFDLDDNPRWSPDGKQIVFTSYRDHHEQIYMMNADGSNQRNISNGTDIDQDASWSPDSTQIAFHSNRDGQWQVYVVHTDGSGLRDLSDIANHDFAPSWSPDGKQIAFTSSRAEDSGIYVMNADGSNQHNISDSGEPDTNPAWQPAPR